MTRLFETAEIDSTHHILSNLYRVRRFHVPGGNAFLRISQDIIGPVQLHHVTFKMNCETRGDPLGVLYFGHVIDGSVTLHHGRDSRTHITGDVFLASQPDIPTHASIDSLEVECVGIDPTVLLQVADGNPAGPAKPIRFTGFHPVTSHDAKVWLRTHAYVRDTFDGGMAATPPLLAANIGRLLAATALSTFPNNARFDLTIEDRHDAHPTTLRRAVSFIEGNAHRDISPADIAAVAHVTIRALQLAFRRHLDTTPTAYVRRVRLAYAHHELLAANPRTTTVSDVAARWGFASHSRFAAHYRTAYGTTPSHTLQRR